MRSQLWDENDAKHYDTNHADRFGAAELDRTVDFLLSYCDDQPSPPLLELAIGTGRVAVPLHQRGAAVAGIELSAPMVDRLREKVSPGEIAVTIGDMSTAEAPPPGPAGFQVVFLVYNTISNLLTQQAQVDCFVNAARHLQPGGHFVVENVIPDIRMLPPTALAVSQDVTDDHVNFDTVDVITQRLTSHHFRRRGDTFVRLASEHRYLWPSEMDLMAWIAGLELVHRVADWDGSPFGQESRSAISVWRRTR